MKMKNAYEGTLLVKKGGYQNYVIHVDAYNLKEAKAEVERRWYETHTAHAFHMKVRALKPTEEFLYHCFVAVE